jgi:hypothetical protein
MRRRTYRALSNLRAEFQRMMSEPTPVSRRASAWWPAVVALEEVMDAVTAAVVAVGRGAAVPAPTAVHALTGTLRAVADSVEADVPPRPGGPLPGDPELEAVTGAVRSVLSVLAGSGDDATPAAVMTQTLTGRQNPSGVAPVSPGEAACGAPRLMRSARG